MPAMSRARTLRTLGTRGTVLADLGWLLHGALRRVKGVIKAPLYALYELRLQGQAASWRKPRHVGIIMDGNRRFARSHGLNLLTDGHRAGAEHLHRVITWCQAQKVGVVTVWALSLDNLNREADELRDLLALIEEKFRAILDHPSIHRNRVRVRSIGRPAGLPAGLVAAINAAEAATAAYDGLTLNIALAYGGREEITDALRAHLRRQAERGLDAMTIADRLEPADIDAHLYNGDLPEPELIIRTSGEERLGGFMLWQSVYSELYFCDAYWPEFRRIDFLRALRAFDRRGRRYGR